MSADIPAVDKAEVPGSRPMSPIASTIRAAISRDARGNRGRGERARGRKRKGDQARIWQAHGIAQSGFNRLVHGKRIPRVGLLREVALALGVRPAWLAWGELPKIAPPERLVRPTENLKASASRAKVKGDAARGTVRRQTKRAKSKSG